MWRFLFASAVGSITAEALVDQHPSCESWAIRGECDANPGYMLHSCQKSCSRVKQLIKAKTRKKVKQPQSEVASSLQKFQECTNIPEGEKSNTIDKGEEACLSQCKGHADCESQCREIEPRSLHSLLQPCAPWQLISNTSSSRGMHVMCMVAAPKGCSTLEGLLVIFMHGLTNRRPLVFEMQSGSASLSDFVLHCESLVKKPARGELYQSSGFFTSMGVRLLDMDTLKQTNPIIMQEGGQWIWPGVRIGHEVKLAGLRHPGEVTTIRTASLVPVVLEIENFLKPDESRHIIDQVRDTVVKSGVQMKDADRGKEAKQFRTSSQSFLSTHNDDKLKVVDARVQSLTGIPITHAESIQVLRYNLKEHYSAHHDFFDPQDYASDAGTLDMIQNGAMNRMATVFFYLTNVTRGGETNFPMFGGRPSPHDYFDCSQGFSSFPKADKVIIFYSMLPSGEMDYSALHGGCDVLEGQKWSANFWLWNKPIPANDGHRERRKTARLLGAVGSPGRRKVEYDARAREQALGAFLEL